MPILEKPVRPRLKLEVYQPPETAWVWGKSKWGIDSWSNENYWEWGVSKWAQAKWGTITNDLEFVDYACDVTNISIKTGKSAEALTNAPDTGTLVVSILETANPLTNHSIHPSTIMRFKYVDLNGIEHVLFTGKILDIANADKFHAGGIKSVNTTITVVDAIFELNNVNRYGAQGVGEHESFKDRITRLAESSPIPVNIPPTNATAYHLQGTVYASSLSNHFTLACDSIGAYWYINTDGEVEFIQSLPDEASTLTFSDSKLDTTALKYVDIATKYDSKTVINELDIINHGAQDDPDNPGNTIADDTQTTIADETSVASWGRIFTSLDMNLWIVGAYQYDIETRAAEILANKSVPKRRFTMLKWNAQENIDQIQNITQYGMIDVKLDGLTQRTRIIGINHDITPTRWIITLQLEQQQNTNLEE